MVMRRNYGFTLIELLVVMGIIAILTTLSIPSFEHHIAQQARHRALISITHIQSLLEQYRSKNHSYQGASLQSLSINNQTSDDRYTIALDIINNNDYELKLNASNKQSSHDESCKQMIASNLGKHTPAKCWQ